MAQMYATHPTENMQATWMREVLTVKAKAANAEGPSRASSWSYGRKPASRRIGCPETGGQGSLTVSGTVVAGPKAKAWPGLR